MRDKDIFKNWECGKMSTATAAYYLAEYNHWEELSDTEFVEIANSLGWYYRGQKSNYI